MKPSVYLGCLAYILAAFLSTSLHGQTSGTQQDSPVTVGLISGSKEYRSEESLTSFAKLLKSEYGVQSIPFLGQDKGNNLPGIANLPKCDVVIVFARRLTLPEEQLELVQHYVESGRPLVGVRTASHAFQNWQPTWQSFDREILGGSYDGHFGDALAQVTLVPEAPAHPILDGVQPFQTRGKLYKNPSLADGATVLLRAATDEHAEPVAWTYRQAGGRVFYTSLGTPEDFDNPNFQRLLVNALFWALDKPVPDANSNSASREKSPRTD